MSFVWLWPGGRLELLHEPPPHLRAVAVHDVHEDVEAVALEEPVQHGVQDSTSQYTGAIPAR